MIPYRHTFKAAYHYFTVSALAISAALAATATPAQAQQARPQGAAASGVEEVIVTARKRQETLLNVPVIETAISQSQLRSRQTTSVEDLTKMVPGLVVGTSLNGGLSINLHGIGQLASATVGDAAVQLNLDGFSVGNSLAFAAGLFDLGQIEVLKGPQALFYGKGTPGGVISLRSADPTDKFEVTAVGSYEFEAITNREELVISGPVTDTLKLRLAGMYSNSEGYFHEVGVPVPGTGALAPPSDRGPGDTTYIVRGTALWNPTDQIDARLKVNLTHDRSVHNDTGELATCPDGTGAPFGVPFIGAGNDCKLSRNVRIVDMNPANFPGGILNNGIAFQANDQKFGSLEVNYHPTQDLTLTSLTGYYFLRDQGLLNTANTTGAGSPFATNAPHFYRHDLNEEVRLNSDFNKPLNFTFGGLYEDVVDHAVISTVKNTADPFLALAPNVLDAVTNHLTSSAYSIFGQLRYKFTPELELSGGARWTDENKDARFVNGITHTVIPLAKNHVHSSTVSPEATLTYKPSDDMTFFASFRQAYLSGGFNSGPTPKAGSNQAFGDEKAQGGEAGMKSRWLDRQLAVDLAVYYYHYSGLQVGSSILDTGVSPPQVVSTTINAGAARSYGIDLDTAYAPETVKGLTLHGALNWDHARFISLPNAPCYGGQTIALGCVTVAGNQQQDLSGTPILRAPDWQFNLGFDYEMPVGGDYMLALSSSVAYSSKYSGSLQKNYPGNFFQSAYAKADLGVTLKAPDDRWELALLGKNITDKIIAAGYTYSSVATGSLGGEVTGGTVRGPAGIDEMLAYPQPGREIWIRVTLKPFN